MYEWNSDTMLSEIMSQLVLIISYVMIIPFNNQLGICH